MKKDTFWYCFIFVVAAFYVAMPRAHAKGLGPVATAKPGGYSFKYSSDGKPLISATGVSGNTIALAGSAAVQLTPSVVIQAAATGAITGAAAAGAWGAAIGAAGSVAIASLPAIKEWMDRARVSVGPGGSFRAPDPALCSVAPCYNFSRDGGNTIFTTGSAAVDSDSSDDVSTHSQRYNQQADGTGRCHVTNTYKDPAYASYNSDDTFRCDFRYGTRPTDPPGATVTISASDAQNRMTSAAPTIAAVQALVDANFPPVVSSVAVIAPAPVFLGNTVQLNADGSTTSIDETATFTVFGADMFINLRKDFKTVNAGKTSTSTTQSVTTNPDGTTSTVSVTATKTTAPGTITGTFSQPKPQDDSSFSDTDLPALSPLYTPKYSAGLSGVWADKKAALLASPLLNLAGMLMPSVAPNGSCPVMMLPLHIGPWDYGSHDVAPPCFIWDLCKWIILISAALLCRALIFGG